MVSYDVKALFTSALVNHAINIVQSRLQQDHLLPQRSSMSIPQIINLLEFCLKNSYFLIQGKYFKQVHSVAMGSPFSPLIGNMFMDEFEVKAISSAPNLPACCSGLWMTPLSSYRQNTIISSSSISSPKPHIHFTTEDPKGDCSITFLPRVQTTPLQPQFTKNLPTQTNTYTGIATTTSQPNIVCTTP